MASKIIVITGASGGIGAAAARQLSARGDKVVLAARRLPELQQVAADCGSGALPVVTDVTSRAQVENLRDEALSAFGRIDVWINNAGRGITRPVLELTDEDFDDIMSANVKSALYGMQAVIPHFKQRGAGHLVNVSSFLGVVPFASYRSIYNAAKAALNSLTANLRMDLRPEFPNIHVSIVMPPRVTSDFAANARYGMSVPAGSFPAGNYTQTPDQVAAVMLDLIDHPRPEVLTNPALADAATRYYLAANGLDEIPGK